MLSVLGADTAELKFTFIESLNQDSEVRIPARRECIQYGPYCLLLCYGMVDLTAFLIN